MAVSIQEKTRREKAKVKIMQVVERIASKNGYRYNRISVKNQRTRLGSCSSKQNLNFNWQIIKFPESIMEYIIKHELAHLVHPNHSKDFWLEVERLDSNYRYHHKWIKENGTKYLRF